MSRDASYLLDILLYAKDAAEFTADMSKKAFLLDHKCQSAVMRCFEVIGEAAKRLSMDFQKANLDIPWSKMAKMRDLTHANQRVDLDEVWDTVKSDIPILIATVERLVPPED
ncbi:MAG: DUF86 domain-containing protein [Deltaproteobacteria bacterium]|nr:DUF86 domain-containing protein [Deltaproteobacteria bacterium]